MNEELQTLDEITGRFNFRLSDDLEETKQNRLTREDKIILGIIYGVVLGILSVACLISYLFG